MTSAQAPATADSSSSKKTDAGGSAERSGRVTVSGVLERFGLVIAWLIVIAIFGVLETDTFLTQANFATIFGSQAVLVVITLGVLLPLTAGDYDLSVAGVLTLSAMMIAVLNVNAGWPVGLAIAAAIGAGVLTGLVNGFLITYFALDSLIVTLGSGTLLGGVVLWISDSNTISGVDNHLVNVVSGNRLLGIPLMFYYGLVLCVLLWYLFERTAPGRRLLCVGQSRTVSRLSGLKVNRLRVAAMVGSSTLGALAGVLFVGQIGGADPSSGLTFLLPAFAAAFLGATSIKPGRFNPWGSTIAVYFLATGVTGLTILGARSFVQSIFYGAALIIAVVLSQIARREEAAEDV